MTEPVQTGNQPRNVKKRILKKAVIGIVEIAPFPRELATTTTTTKIVIIKLWIIPLCVLVVFIKSAEF